MKHATPVCNCMKLDASEKRCRYVFVDSPDHRADRILIGELIPAVFERCDAVSQPQARSFVKAFGQRMSESGYELRVCHFDSKYEAWFLNCMADLAWVLEGDDEKAGRNGAYAKACKTLLAAAPAA